MKNPESAIIPRLVSEQASTHALLNCLIKEFALPEGGLHYCWPQQMQGITPSHCLQAIRHGGMPLCIQLSDAWQCFVLVDRRDALGSQRYLSDVYTRQGDADWSAPDFATLVAQILAGCQQRVGGDNHELPQQIEQSQRLTARILVHNLHQDVQHPLTDYLASEQGLWFGHPSHPAPKARLWPEDLAQETFAPEFQAMTALHQFAVPQEGLIVYGNGLTAQQVLAGFADQRQAADGQAIIVMHPVQARLFLQDPRVQQLLAQGQITDLGPSGFRAAPTASIRTWYLAQHDYFIKGSLNVRITNCVRKNAWYELESTMIIDRLFRRLKQTASDTLEGLTAVAEPGVLSWSPRIASESDRNWFREQTGAILRENFCRQYGEENCLMAGTLFARDGQLQPLIRQVLQQCYGSTLSDDQRLQWFADYQRLLLGPVLALFFNHGIVMEPHLQNTVLVHHQGRPQQVLLRDFEGVKLTDDLGICQVELDIHPRVRQSLLYSREQGWQRIMYCLFINNLSEAVLALSWQRPAMASQMWQQVWAQLQQIQRRLRAPAPELAALIAGGPISCKTNLKVRLAAQADRQAGYVPLPSPWRQAVVHD
ncbi:N(2)-citryl-N(6)-acetyl-N(6)-hydroxylysine synthase (plasmid) [Sodalis glossinidius str. 'morsitans']|uniref:Achromobactin biosynthetic and transport gene acsD n=1 Tax=Sodalis glossinidius (strain morsitans) TaxID=343509 RepID=Q2NQ24_SODGM|nr:IucA/IucC family protein [Sodalis glossinidius]BAE75751.1 achromobactin biosynthetic and transport gene acsD [Sodalis glossinidius str. 'morsitans']CAI59316.1 AcsD protein [Sodalis glossinidius]CAI59489.1 AcsD protein [Sodalis glossinidius]CRL46870.1 N(2)-citryl-N(6)-acetyl-N(6)-hydroxylysine synthase [Sodalis glossinidius str. 'morsitans']